MRAPQRLTTALKAFRDVCVLWLQRWRSCWSRSRPAVDIKWLAGARDENRLDMIERRRPRPWTHFPKHEIITEGLLIIVGTFVLLAGYRGKKRPAPVCLLTEARSSHRVRYEVVSDQTRLILADSYQTIAYGQNTRRGVKLSVHPRPALALCQRLLNDAIEGGVRPKLGG